MTILAGQNPSAEYSKVLYKDGEQRERVTSLLQKAIRLVESESAATQRVEEYSVVAAKHLVRLLPILKDPEYEREAEWRLIVWHRPGDQPPAVETSCSVVRPSPAVEASRGILRPYIDFRLGEPPPVIAVNIMAPTRRELALKATTILLDAAGVGGVTPHHSKIPFAD